MKLANILIVGALLSLFGTGSFAKTEPPVTTPVKDVKAAAATPAQKAKSATPATPATPTVPSTPSAKGATPATPATPAVPVPPAAKGAKQASAPAAAPAGKNMVWVNAKSKVYHKPGSKWYGKTKNGSYLPEAEAIKAGYREGKQGAVGKKP